MYFIPMFDDTDGYYDSSSAVRIPKPSISLALELTSNSGGPTGVP